jgi:hypothetical protein
MGVHQVAGAGILKKKQMKHEGTKLKKIAKASFCTPKTNLFLIGGLQTDNLLLRG